MDVNARIKQLMENRGWTEYKLAQVSEVAPTTIANIFHRGTVPSIITLEALCKAFGITLSQFFAEDDMVSLSEDQKDILVEWSYLDDKQKTNLIELLKGYRK